MSDVNVHISELTSIEYVPNCVLPRLGDDSKMKENIATLISRVLFQYLDFFQLSFDGVFEWHIQHKNYSEMSCKSEVVCTLIILDHIMHKHLWFYRFPLVLFSKMRTSNGMILTQLHKYVPQSTYFIEKAVSTGEVEKIEKAIMSDIPGVCSFIFPLIAHRTLAAVN